MSAHADVLPAGTIEAAVHWGAIKSYGITSCPLCESSGPLDDPELIDHVLQHTHDFSLRAIPWPKQNPLTSAVAGTYNLSCPASNNVQQWLSVIAAENEGGGGEPAASRLQLGACNGLVPGIEKESCSADYFATHDYFEERSDMSTQPGWFGRCAC